MTREELLAHYKLKLSDLQPKYLFIPTGDHRDFAIAVKNRPFFFIRWMQRLFFGFKYMPIAKANKLWENKP
jgi:hypothetical protein